MCVMFLLSLGTIAACAPVYSRVRDLSFHFGLSPGFDLCLFVASLALGLVYSFYFISPCSCFYFFGHSFV